MGHPRKPLRLRARFDVLAAAGFRCFYCGRKAPSVHLHVDHVVPIALGGTNDPENLVASCVDCNLGKADRTLPTMRATIVQCRAQTIGMETLATLRSLIEACPGDSPVVLEMFDGHRGYEGLRLGLRVDPFALAGRIVRERATGLFTVWVDA